MTAPDEITIEVTDLDIQQGERDNICRCPIARATARQLSLPLGDYYTSRILVEPGELAIVFDPAQDEFDSYVLPSEAKQFIEDYDNDGIGAVKPFTFTAKHWSPES